MSKEKNRVVAYLSDEERGLFDAEQARREALAGVDIPTSTVARALIRERLTMIQSSGPIHLEDEEGEAATVVDGAADES